MKGGWVMVLVTAAVLAVLAAVGWRTLGAIRTEGAARGEEVPTARVRRGRVTLTVTASGELQGGNSEILTAPMTGADQLVITELREPGELVKPGDTVVAFDRTPLEYNLQSAQAGLAETEQGVLSAEAAAESIDEQTHYAVLAAEAATRIAALEMRRNPLLPAIAARQNELKLEAARSHQRQAEQDEKNEHANVTTGVTVQKASENNARLMVTLAERNLDSMVLKARTAGYVSVQPNSNQNAVSYGMQLPNFQVGDTVRAGQVVALIPDLAHLEVVADIPELDRGRLAVGQKATVRAVGLPGRAFAGHIQNLGGTSGPPWNRSFECRVAVDESGPELRPGMSCHLTILEETLDNVLWAPSQVVFENDGRAFVYLRTPRGFEAREVTVVRRNEHQAVLRGLREGDRVALADPERRRAIPTGNAADGALRAISQ